MSGTCKPGGPWCVGMKAMLDADAARGLQVAESVNLTSGAFMMVIVHAAVHEGRKAKMRLSYCPCCRAKIEASRSKKKTVRP